MQHIYYHVNLSSPLSVELLCEESTDLVHVSLPLLKVRRVA